MFYYVEKIYTDYHCRDAVDARRRDSDERVGLIFQTGNRSDRIFSFPIQFGRYLTGIVAVPLVTKFLLPKIGLRMTSILGGVFGALASSYCPTVNPCWRSTWGQSSSERS